MKKFFFFKSSGSGSENKNSSSKSLIDKDVYWEHPSENGLTNHVKNQSHIAKSGFRRSRSLSMAAIQESGLERIDFSCSSGRSGSPFSVRSNDPKKPSSRHWKLKTERTEPDAFENANRLERRRASTSHASLQELLDSSFSSRNSSSKVVDHYIDGEQQEGRPFGNGHSQRTYIGDVKEKSKRPPRAQYRASTLLAGSFTEKLNSHPFRDVTGTQQKFPSRDWAENGYHFESPRKIAKNVIERLSRCNSQQKTSPKDGPNSNSPVTFEVINGSSLDRPCGLTRQSTPLNGGSIESRENDVDGLSSSVKRKLYVADSGVDSNSVMDEDEKDVELPTALKEANERAMLLSEEFEEQRFICDNDLNESALLQKIRSLVEEKMTLAFEVWSNLQARIADRANTNAELEHIKIEMSNRTQRLEREKSEVQQSLETELDRRSRDWLLKLEKYRSEEHRLGERVRDLAEQNVAMQKEIAAIKEMEVEIRNTVMHSDQQLKNQIVRLDELREQNQDLKDNLAQLKEQYTVATEDQDCFRRYYVEKETECKDLQKSITRLIRTTSEQDKTICELRESLLERVEVSIFPESVNNRAKRLLAEQIRLTGVEQALRKEVDSFKLEAESLRGENIELINRLKEFDQEGSLFTLKFDQEMGARIQCLQNQGISLLNESMQLCSKLQIVIKGKAHTIPDTQQVVETIRNSLDGEFIIESDVKIRGFKCRIESFTRSLQTISVLLNQKSNQAALDLQSNCTDNEQQSEIKPNSKVVLNWELKEEMLVTNLLREIMHCKDMEIEQLQAELATAVRGNEILKCEVQNALDCFSVANHKVKELEVQTIKKDENLNRTQGELQESTEELTRIKAVLQNVSDERDVMWEEIKQYSEKNMLLNSEVNGLKKKIEVLDEDLLLKEGQISILKDNLGRNPFDPIASPTST